VSRRTYVGAMGPLVRRHERSRAVHPDAQRLTPGTSFASEGRYGDKACLALLRSTS